eukprot:m.310587 g.310587  ORF g.310587 m.310587 type:complete len:718 (+) comp52871_c0_seq1:102-2255(+)
MRRRGQAEMEADEEALITDQDENDGAKGAETEVPAKAAERQPPDYTVKGPPKRKPTSRCLIAAVVILGVVSCVAIVLAYTLNPIVSENPNVIEIDERRKTIVLSRGSQTVLQGSIGASLRTGEPLTHRNETVYNITWKEDAELLVHQPNVSDPLAACFHLQWTLIGDLERLEDCYDVADSRWYGGAETYNSTWPWETNGKLEMRAFTSGDLYSDHSALGSVLQPVWLGSSGVAIIVDRNVPLFVGLGDGKICLKAELGRLAYPSYGEVLKLGYTLCVHDGLRSVYQLVADMHFKRPTGMPAPSMFQKPIWSTWAQYKADINETKVLDFAREIAEHGFEVGNFEIDDKYSSAYGDFDFDTLKFPNASGMIDILHGNGFNVTVWVYPFANIDSKAFKEGSERGYWVKGVKTHLNLVSWWNSPSSSAAVLDVTESTARDWFVRRLEDMRSTYGVDSFKFDAGESSYLPDAYQFEEKLENPGDYAAIYASLATHFLPLTEVRVGYFTQHLPIFVRVMDKDSRWGLDNGLHALITSVLTLSIMGYPFILPDMIGGNAYGSDDTHDTVCPSEDLFIRWAQATALMPAMQFSLVPWNKNCFSSAVEPAKKAAQLHERFSTYILDLANESMSTGHPIVRPLWWIAQYDVKAQMVNDQFLLGDDIVVAPVVTPESSRDVYLPEGIWVDGNSKDSTHYSGPKTISKYDATSILPFFVRQDSKAEKLL